MITISAVTLGWNLFCMFIGGNLFMLALMLYIQNKMTGGGK